MKTHWMGLAKDTDEHVEKADSTPESPVHASCSRTRNSSSGVGGVVVVATVGVEIRSSSDDNHDVGTVTKGYLW